jgi:hypothetical protein
MYSACYSCEILIKIEFSRQIFEKYSDVKLRQCHPVGREFFPTDRRTDRQTDRQTDTRDETNSRFPKFRELA